MSNQKLTAASMPLKIGSKTFQASPLSDKDLTELDNWVRADFIRTARKSLTPDMSTAEREETLSVAMRIAQTLCAFRGSGARQLASVDGMIRLVWQSVKHNHPNVTEDELRALLLTPEAAAEAIAETNSVFAMLNMPEQKQPAKNAGKKGGARRTARRQK